MHPATFAQWIALVERYRQAVKVYADAVRLLPGLSGEDYVMAYRQAEQAHQVCEHLRQALGEYHTNNRAEAARPD